MSIDLTVLGRPGEDNATLIKINSGSSIHRLLFDCGGKCLDRTPVSEIQEIDHLIFSHYHMDHICGFDTFFRHNYNRPMGPVTVWGPPGSIDVLHNRFRGFTWNLHHRQRGEWVVNEFDGTTLKAAKFKTREAFSRRHRLSNRTIGKGGTLYTHECYTLSYFPLNHGTIPSMAYRITEPDRENVDPEKLVKTGLKPGPWLRELKESTDQSDTKIEIDGEPHSIKSLRENLLVDTKGESIACLTDFILEPGSDEWNEVVDWLSGVNTIVCEAQYTEADYEYAMSNHHMTATRVAQLAKDAKADRLIIQHVSRRYTAKEWKDMLVEAREVFENTHFPENWKFINNA